MQKNRSTNDPIFMGKNHRIRWYAHINQTHTIDRYWSYDSIDRKISTLKNLIPKKTGTSNKPINIFTKEYKNKWTRKRVRSGWDPKTRRPATKLHFTAKKLFEIVKLMDMKSHQILEFQKKLWPEK